MLLYPATMLRICAFVLLMLLGALLTAGRAALAAISDSSLKKMAADGNQKARFIVTLLGRPVAFLEGLKLAAFTCMAIAAPVGYALFSMPLFDLLRERQARTFIPTPFWLISLVAVGAFLVMVLLLYVFSMLLPNRIACRHSQAVAFALARFTAGASWLFRPLAAVCAALAGVFARLCGIRGEDAPGQATEEEIRLMVDVGSETGEIEPGEKEMINNIFEFDDRSVSAVMTHRTDMTAIAKSAGIEEITALAIETGYSRIPVYGDDLDDIIGMLYAKDLLQFVGHPDETFDAARYMRSALFVPENVCCLDLLAQFKRQKVQIAIAVDEYGGTAGIVSMEDLLESIVGNIQDEYDDEDEEIARLDEDDYSVDGATAIEDVERLFGVTLDENSDYETIGGLLTERLECIPAPEEHPSVVIAGVELTVLSVDERRIMRVRARRAEVAE